MASRKGGGDDWILLVAILIALLIGGGGSIGSGKGGETPPSGQPTVSVAPVDLNAAKAALAELGTVPDGTTAAGYNRTDSFGAAWKDVDRNGCDTRNDILKRDLKNPVFKSGSNCVVISGVLDPDPYTGKKIVWTKGDQPGIDIDHMVPLKRAWDMGANKWDQAKREAYANDPAILLAVDGSANRSKSDQGPGTWMPPSTANVCGYAVHYIAVSAKYQLNITTSDKAVLETTLKGC